MKNPNRYEYWLLDKTPFEGRLRVLCSVSARNSRSNSSSNGNGYRSFLMTTRCEACSPMTDRDWRTRQQSLVAKRRSAIASATRRAKFTIDARGDCAIQESRGRKIQNRSKVVGIWPGSVSSESEPAGRWKSDGLRGRVHDKRPSGAFGKLQLGSERDVSFWRSSVVQSGPVGRRPDILRPLLHRRIQLLLPSSTLPARPQNRTLAAETPAAETRR